MNLAVQEDDCNAFEIHLTKTDGVKLRKAGLKYPRWWQDRHNR